MKRIILTTLAVLLTVAATAKPVDPTRARKVAAHAYRIHSMELSANKEASPDVVRWDCEEVNAQGLEHIMMFNMYGYDRMDRVVEEGFVVVSGDDIAAPVLAFSTEGTLPQEGLKAVNPSAFGHLKQYGLQIAHAISIGTASTPAIAAKWAELESEDAVEHVRIQLNAKGEYLNDNIPQLLGDMRWGQGRPYNNKCPGGSVTGCVATAFGMIMNYWDYPEHGFGHFSYNGADNPAAYGNWTYGVQSADFEHTYYDWEHIEDFAFINSPTDVVEAMSTLLYQIGVSLSMNYSPSGSGCWSLPEYALFDTSLHLAPIAYTLGADYRIPRHFGYKYSYSGMRDSIGNDSLWLTMLYNSLAEGKPIYYAGWAAADNEAGHSGTSGHGYILDGYFSDINDTNFFHINWGWSGSSDGYFKIDAMRPSSSDFTKWHGAIIGLEPDTSYHGYDYTDIRPTRIDDVVVYGGSGYLSVRNALGRRVAIFDLMGRQVFGNTVRDSEWKLALRPGVYAVRVGAAPAKTIIVL